jgi:cathepsin L
VDCVENKQQCGGSGGCEGATPDLLFQYATTGGAVKESDYPYVARDGTCKTSVSMAVRVSGYSDVENNNYDAMMSAIAGRPIAIGVAANEWFSYDSGVFSFNDCGSDVNHAVLLVGYGTDEQGGDYWKVQNSWGSTWGEDGFIRLARSDKDSSNCQMDKTPLDGFGCKGGPSEVQICGTCGLLYGAAYPTGCSTA